MAKSKLFFIFLGLVFLLSLASFSYLAGLAKKGVEKSNVTQITNEPAPEQKSQLQLETALNILVVGIDKATSINGPLRPGPWRADVIMLVGVDPSTRQISCLSIPRDTRVNIPGHGLEKIAHAYAYGSMPLTVKTVEEFTGVKINRFLNIDYATFARMVDMVGGIEVDVPKELKTKYFTFYPGRQKMNGKQAYVYVNCRDEPMADIARIERQHQFSLSLLKKIREQADVLDLARLYLEFKKGSDTSLSAVDIIKLALFARRINLDKVSITTLPGKPEYIDGLSYWIADRERLRQIRKATF